MLLRLEKFLREVQQEDCEQQGTKKFSSQEERTREKETTPAFDIRQTPRTFLSITAQGDRGMFRVESGRGQGASL